jgi:hypothetical protein
MNKIIEEVFGKLKQRFVFNLRIVFNLQNGLTKIASRLFYRSFSPNRLDTKSFKTFRPGGNFFSKTVLSLFIQQCLWI